MMMRSIMFHGPFPVKSNKMKRMIYYACQNGHSLHLQINGGNIHEDHLQMHYV
jgi:hypothetical protein